MSNETQTHPQPTSDNDRAWAQRMAEAKERRDTERHNELKQLGELTQHGVSRLSVEMEETKVKVDAIYETVVGDEPTSTFGKFIQKVDRGISKALPYLTVAGAAAAVGYGSYRGAKAVRGMFGKKVDVHADVTIAPVGEPLKVETTPAKR